MFNIKEAAKTLNFLTDNGINDYEELASRAKEAGQKFNAASLRIKQIEARIGQLTTLRAHIISYSKTREVYVAYCKAKNKNAFRLDHESELATHKAAKKAFDKLGGTAIPKMSQIQEDYNTLIAEKKSCYETYNAAKKDMLNYGMAKQTVDRLLRVQTPERDKRTLYER